METRKIVLVDDDRNQRKLYEQELSEEGYEVAAFEGAREALTAIEESRPDVVILDISMPGMDGLEALGRVLGMDNTTPVIFNTAYPHYRNNFLSWAADAYVVKSSDMGELKTTINTVLEQRQREAAETHTSGEKQVTGS
jgi:DNA-binding response OmpR family regulator